LARKTKVLGENLPQCNSVHKTISKWASVVSKSSRCGWKKENIKKEKIKNKQCLEKRVGITE
jgi:hypothetical protein